MGVPQAVRLLKEDAFGRVERLEGSHGVFVRRVACGSSLLASRLIARALLARERRALEHLAGTAGVPTLVPREEWPEFWPPTEEAPDPREVLVRTWVVGIPLWATPTLPRDYFDRLRELVLELHERGVCHNDLHKEPNILVQPSGEPALLDFQLSSRHKKGSRRRRVRAEEDLRHVAKHRARYVRAMDAGGVEPGRGAGRHRSIVARGWMALGKPLYNRLTARFGKPEVHEPRRPAGGPWPTWADPL